MSEVNAQRKKHRSPAYPAIGIREAIERTQAVLDEGGKHSMPIDALATAWHYSPSSSAVLQIVSALKQYGLLLDEGSGNDRVVNVSPIGRDIVWLEDGRERDEAIRIAALKPKMHAELWQHLEQELPPSDAPIKHFLLRTKEFNPAAVGDFIKQFRDTISFAKLGKTGIIKQEEENGQEDYQKGTGMSAVAPPRDDNAVIRDFPIPLISGGVAVVKVPVPMSELDFEQLTNTLQAWKAGAGAFGGAQ